MFTGAHVAADVELSERCRFRQELVHTQGLIKGIYFYLVREIMGASQIAILKLFLLLDSYPP